MARCSGTKNEPFIPSLDGAGLSLEFRVVRSLFEYRKQTHRQRSVGAFVLPFILVFFLAAHLAPADRLPPPAVHGAIFALHVALSILAYAAFALSFVLSLIFLGEERLLRRHKVGDVVWRLP